MSLLFNLLNPTRRLTKIITLSLVIFCLLSSYVFAEDLGEKDKTKWTIYFRPGVRFGTDDRTLYVMDFLVPLYQDDKNIFFTVR